MRLFINSAYKLILILSDVIFYLKITYYFNIVLLTLTFVCFLIEKNNYIIIV